MSEVICPTCCVPIRSPGICGSCGFDVPRQWFDEHRLSLAMTGARYTGKSVLIAVMMQQFRYFLEQRHNTFLEPLGSTNETFVEFYVNPLYTNKETLKSTPNAITKPIVPLLWSFRYGEERFCLALYDAAGEDFERLAPSDPAFTYLAHVDLIASLIDPLKVDGISAVLDGEVTVPAGASDDLTVMRHVLTARAAHAGSSSPRPALAIVLSKFDVVQALRVLPATPWQSIMNRPGSAMQRDPSFVSLTEDNRESDLLHAELESLLAIMGARLLLAAAKESGLPSRLFAVSALGIPPRSEAVHPGGITPFRVIEILKAGLTLKQREIAK